LLSGVIYFFNERENRYIQNIVVETGSCFLDDGTCLHAERDYTLIIFGWVMSFGLIVLGIYLFFFDRTQTILAEHQVKVSSALKEAEKDDKFKAFLAGFGKDEQTVLKSVRDMDGIKQSTLRYRTAMSKASLSLMLKSLESRDIISRKKSGKTNEVYLRKKI